MSCIRDSDFRLNPVYPFRIRNNRTCTLFCLENLAGCGEDLIYFHRMYARMSPRSCRTRKSVASSDDRVHGTQASRERWKIIQFRKHHPMTVLRPDRPHQSTPKPRTGLRHSPHSHPHGEQLGPHTNPPGPIRFPLNMNRRGIRT